jgi:hypothetical protein
MAETFGTTYDPTLGGRGKLAEGVYPGDRDFLTEDVPAVPEFVREPLAREATHGLGFLAVPHLPETPPELAAKNAEFADMVMTLASGGVGARIHEQHLSAVPDALASPIEAAFSADPFAPDMEPEFTDAVSAARANVADALAA